MNVEEVMVNGPERNEEIAPPDPSLSEAQHPENVEEIMINEPELNELMAPPLPVPAEHPENVEEVMINEPSVKMAPPEPSVFPFRIVRLLIVIDDASVTVKILVPAFWPSMIVSDGPWPCIVSALKVRFFPVMVIPFSL